MARAARILVVAVLALTFTDTAARHLFDHDGPPRLPRYPGFRPFASWSTSELRRSGRDMRSDGGSSSSDGGSSGEAESERSRGDWTRYRGLTCYDDHSNEGSLLSVRRGVSSLDSCQRECEEESPCNAVTHNSATRTCYLWESCDELRNLNNGDSSAVLEREPDSSSSEEVDSSEEDDSSDAINTGDEIIYDWEYLPNQSCLDDWRTLRNVRTFEDCQRECEAREECNGITYSNAQSCFLKQTCNDLVARNNGDNSALLTRRTTCEPPTQVFCTSASQSSNCRNFCGPSLSSAPLQSAEQCGGVIYVCL